MITIGGLQTLFTVNLLFKQLFILKCNMSDRQKRHWMWGLTPTDLLRWSLQGHPQGTVCKLLLQASFHILPKRYQGPEKVKESPHISACQKQKKV